MKRPRLSPPSLLSDSVIERITTEVHTTGQAQIIRDSHCPGLRLVVARSSNLRWTLVTLNHQGRKEEHILGHYPRVTIAQARAKGWNLRLRIQMPESYVRPTSGITLAKLIFQCEGFAVAVPYLAQLRARLCHAFRPFLFLPWSGVDRLEIQKHIDAYSSPGNMRQLLPPFQAMLLWAEEQGLIAMSGVVLVPPKARNAAELARLDDLAVRMG